MTALLNDAYRTLRHPVRRVEYLLELEGFKSDGSKVPKSFLMEVFEINEQLEEVKAGAASNGTDCRAATRDRRTGRSDLKRNSQTGFGGMGQALVRAGASDELRKAATVAG